MNQDGTDSASYEHLIAIRRIMFSAAAAALITFGTAAAGVALAQEDAKPIPPPQDGIQAPTGHRQPRPQDLPPKVLNSEGGTTQSEKELDRKLNSICRGC